MIMTITSCFKKPVSMEQSTNPNFQVEFLFEYDGVRVYRFIDGGSYRYFAKRVDGVSVSWESSIGKTTYPISIDTIQ